MDKIDGIGPTIEAREADMIKNISKVDQSGEAAPAELSKVEVMRQLSGGLSEAGGKIGGAGLKRLLGSAGKA